MSDMFSVPDKWGEMAGGGAAHLQQLQLIVAGVGGAGAQQHLVNAGGLHGAAGIEVHGSGGIQIDVGVFPGDLHGTGVIIVQPLPPQNDVYIGVVLGNGGEKHRQAEGLGGAVAPHNGLMLAAHVQQRVEHLVLAEHVAMADGIHI